MYTLLVSCVGGELTPDLITLALKSKRHDLRVIGVDASSQASGRHFTDKFFQVPHSLDDNYINCMADIITQEEVDLLLPTSDGEALKLSQNRHVIETAGAILACGEMETLAMLSNKANCYTKLSELGMSLPYWSQANSVEELSESVANAYQMHGELVIKPATERGGRGIFVIRKNLTGEHPYEGGRAIHLDIGTFLKTRVNFFKQRLPAIIMQRLADPVYDVDLLAWQGKPLRIIPRRHNSIRGVGSSQPREGHTIIDDPKLIALGSEITEKLKLSWLYDLDVMFDINGEPCVLEINPRPSGSFSASIRAGIPLLDDLISLAKGEKLPQVEIPNGRTVVTHTATTVARTRGHQELE